MKITVLNENTAHRPDVTAQHGLSLWMETEGRKILFDMGQSDVFLKNAEVLGVDVSTADLAVISHGHYDHGGGLPYFLEVNKKAPVYLSPLAFGDYYNGTEKYIGLDKRLEGNPRIVYTHDGMEIGKGLNIYFCNEKERPHWMGSFGLNRKENGQCLPDCFLHEQYLLIEEKGKKILISGCSHKGILDIVSWFHPDVLIGGFHLSKIAPGAELAKIAVELDRYDTEYYTCHCTGVEQCEFMKGYMNRLHGIGCGDVFEI